LIIEKEGKRPFVAPNNKKQLSKADNVITGSPIIPAGNYNLSLALLTV
jgi:hypothetical protein